MNRKSVIQQLAVWLTAALLLTGCVQTAGSFSAGGAIQEMIPSKSVEPTASQTYTKAASVTATATVTPTPTRTHTPTPTLYALEVFDSTLLRKDVEPAAYIEDTCDYLSLRWGEGKSKPGTIVVPFMYHSVRQAGKPVNDNMTVSEEYFLETMRHAEALGFKTVTTEELIGFLTRNELIPERAMILIIDDRRPGVVREHFLPVLEENDWSVTLAYITGAALQWEWDELERMYATGHLDIQSHGFMHQPDTYFTEFTSPEVIEQEVYGSIPLIEEHFGQRPLAFIWPGGNFTLPAIQTVYEAGYKLGFTAYSRGPLQFNWIPLGPEEREMKDPLMVLPRYWSTSAYINLDEAVRIQMEAQDFAEAQQAEEYRWFSTYCSGYPPLNSGVTEDEDGKS